MYEFMYVAFFVGDLQTHILTFEIGKLANHCYPMPMNSLDLYIKIDKLTTACQRCMTPIDMYFMLPVCVTHRNRLLHTLEHNVLL